MNVLSRRRIPPMPIEDLIDHPMRKAMPAAGRGMIDELCMHFWSTECRSFPMDEDTVFRIAQAHRPTWRNHRAEILAIFEDIRPRLERAWQARQTKHAVLRDWSAAAMANRRKAKAVAGETETPARTAPKHNWRRKSKLAGERFAEPASEVEQKDEAFQD
jgi:hypothetical protein